jgi:SAM-dependent methyltransferase
MPHGRGPAVEHESHRAGSRETSLSAPPRRSTATTARILRAPGFAALAERAAPVGPDLVAVTVGMCGVATFPGAALYPGGAAYVQPSRERYVPAVKEYYEELWASLPDDLDPPDLELRRRFARSALTAADRVLDLGCGTGDLTTDLATVSPQITGADVAEAALARASRRHPRLELRLVPFDGPLPFSDAAFDVVWSSEVIEHVADTARWLSEVRRVLAPGGRLLLTTPSHGRLRLLIGGVERYSDPVGDHLHLYTARSLRELLRDFGFAEISVRRAGGPPLLRRLLLALAVRP